MNRPLHVFFLLVFTSAVALGQSNSTCAEVLGVAGGSNTLGNRYFAYTVGEPVILTLTGMNFQVTQGFHQPEICRIVSVHNLDIEKLQLTVFPNPATDQFTIRLKAGSTPALRAAVYDLYGRLVTAPFELDESTGVTKLNCSGWQPGVYLLQINDPLRDASATVRLVRQ